MKNGIRPKLLTAASGAHFTCTLPAKVSAVRIATAGAREGQQSALLAAGPRDHSAPGSLPAPGAAPGLWFAFVRRSQGARSGTAYDRRGAALSVPPSPPNHHRAEGQPPPVSTHLRYRHDPRRRQSAGPDATHGSCQDRNHAGLRATHFTGRVSSVTRVQISCLTAFCTLKTLDIARL